MIIEKKELIEIEQLISQVDEFHYADDDDPSVEAPHDAEFFAHRPHLIMPLGFDEYKAVEVENYEPVDSSIRLPDVPHAELMFPYESYHRDSSSGGWYWLDGVTHFSKDENRKHNTKPGERYLHFTGAENDHRYYPVSKWVEGLKKIIEAPDPNPHSFIWSPKIQIEQQSSLKNTVPDILSSIYSEGKTLRDIHWRHLEELVADLLISRGMEVIVTPRSRDGGRDIIARGEFIPGEPTLLAVEVKQKDVVGIADVQRFLHANSDFPVLMLATSGRFSGGVIAEKNRNRNQFRLLLKDGLAINQWLNPTRGKSQ